jgi:hypothetical protein
VKIIIKPTLMDRITILKKQDHSMQDLKVIRTLSIKNFPIKRVKILKRSARKSKLKKVEETIQ